MGQTKPAKAKKGRDMIILVILVAIGVLIGLIKGVLFVVGTWGPQIAVGLIIGIPVMCGVAYALLHGMMKRTGGVVRQPPKPPRLSLPSPLGELRPDMDRPFTEFIADPEPDEAARGGTCEGPACSQPLPEDPWRAGTAPVFTGDDMRSRPGESHSFCSERCMQRWMRRDQAARVGRNQS